MNDFSDIIIQKQLPFRGTLEKIQAIWVRPELKFAIMSFEVLTETMKFDEIIEGEIFDFYGLKLRIISIQHDYDRVIVGRISHV